MRLTAKEMDIADDALAEYTETGATKINCPRCQAGLKIKIGASGESVRCIKCEFRMTVRGI